MTIDQKAVRKAKIEMEKQGKWNFGITMPKTMKNQGDMPWDLYKEFGQIYQDEKDRLYNEAQ